VEGPRALRPEELGSLVRLANRVFRPQGGDMGAEFAYFLNAANAARLRVFVEKGEVLAHSGYRLQDASVFGCRLRIACLGAVCTSPDFRGKGLATRLFHDGLAAMRAEGVDLAMISGGRGLYTRNAAVPAATCRQASFEAASAGSWAQDNVEVTPAAPADAPRLAALYRAEPVRFLRPPADWAGILAGRWCMNRPARLLAIRRGGEIVAYAAARAPKGAEADPAGGTLLGEFAGCRRALVSALPRLAELGGCRALLVPVPLWDAPLAAELAARNLVPGPANAASGTVKLVNFPQLMLRLGELFVERAGPRFGEVRFAESAGRAALSLDAERLELAEADACRAVFGTPARTETALLEGRGELGRLLLAALPAEIPWYGYNYV
jgi:predicted N-acetyltransferase YhbS